MILVPWVVGFNPLVARLQIHTYMLPGWWSWHCRLCYWLYNARVLSPGRWDHYRNMSKTQCSHVYCSIVCMIANKGLHNRKPYIIINSIIICKEIKSMCIWINWNIIYIRAVASVITCDNIHITKLIRGCMHIGIVYQVLALAPSTDICRTYIVQNSLWSSPVPTICQACCFQSVLSIECSKRTLSTKPSIIPV